ncbi:TPA: LOW QUALITY PROTEIN: hypothetical protein N0F65_002895 [Lagenidium giganteum]|uniref:Uncharacterized protein n=1 Tax=Lagenidium giganteum TaxID=4803 RepID=A0AAV2Z9Q3_9STRA|nr:TPA: LOW QUALITY PROTEIN: hypothetical protein N0F65_002895 [Lagenidium giganteum]
MMARTMAAAAVDGDTSSSVEPLLEHGETDASVHLKHKKKRFWAGQRPIELGWKRVGVVFGCFLLVLLLVHVFFVLLLRNTTVDLEQLIVPDMCHTKSEGETVLNLHNPSYCQPRVGPLTIDVKRHNTSLVNVHLPAFDLSSGSSKVLLTVDYHMQTDAHTFYDIVFGASDAFLVHGVLPVEISCFLIPFTVKIDIGSMIENALKAQKGGQSPPGWRFRLPTSVEELEASRARKLSFDLQGELERLVTRVLKTIGLSHVVINSDDQEIFAFTDVSFDFSSQLLWNLPTLSLQMASDTRETILVAGFKQFVLGGGKTFISVFTDIFKSQTQPLQNMLQSFLSGDDVRLLVKGSNAGSDCFSLQVLDLVDMWLTVPGKIDGQPLLLRHYLVKPTLKELDSIKHKCLLELQVEIAVNNPLPIEIDLYQIAFDLLYVDVSDSPKEDPTFLLHIDDHNAIKWKAHEEHNITFSSAIREFDTCKDVIGVYLQDHLAFAIQHGQIQLGAANGNVTIPFSVAQIRIHPTQDETFTHRVLLELRTKHSSTWPPSFIATRRTIQRSVREHGLIVVATSLHGRISYPAYASFKALETRSPHDDKQWLTYWVVYGLCTSMETVSGKFTRWIPGYYITKMLFLIWMMLPKTKGAMIMYNVVLYPLLKKYEPYIDRKLLEAQAVAEECIEDFQKHGSEAISRRLVAVQKSEMVTNLTKAITSPLNSPRLRKQLRHVKNAIDKKQKVKVHAIKHVDVPPQVNPAEEQTPDVVTMD